MEGADGQGVRGHCFVFKNHFKADINSSDKDWRGLTDLESIKYTMGLNSSGSKILFSKITRFNLQKLLGSFRDQWRTSIFSRKKEDISIFKDQPAPLKDNTPCSFCKIILIAAILVSLGYYKQNTIHWVVYTTDIYFSPSWRTEVQNKGAQMVKFW